MKPLHRKRTVNSCFHALILSPFFHSKAVCGWKYRKRQISFNVVFGKFGSLSVMCYKCSFLYVSSIWTNLFCVKRFLCYRSHLRVKNVLSLSQSSQSLNSAITLIMRISKWKMYINCRNSTYSLQRSNM